MLNTVVTDPKKKAVLCVIVLRESALKGIGF